MQNEQFQKLVLEKLSSIDNEINEIKTTQEIRFKSIDDKFESIDKKFESIDKKFESIDKRFESIDKRFDNMEEQLHILNVKHNETFEVVKAIEHSNNISRAMLDKHEYEIAKNKADIQKIKEAINLA